MNRSWITGLTLASVAGSGGAFAAAASSNDAPVVVAQPQNFVKASELVQTPQSRAINYQVGAAGTVTLTVTDGTLAVTNATMGAGWTVATTTALGTHVEVQFTDTIQLATFGADLVNNEVVVALTNVAAPGAVTATAPAPLDVTVIAPANTARTAAQPRPATPRPAAVQPSAGPTTAQPPKPAATTAPSGSGDDGKRDDQHEESNDD